MPSLCHRWELADISRKIFMLSVIIFIGNGTISQVLVGFLAQCAFTFLTALYSPYENDMDDSMAHGCNICLCLQLLAGIVFKASIGNSEGKHFLCIELCGTHRIACCPQLTTLSVHVSL